MQTRTVGLATLALWLAAGCTGQIATSNPSDQPAGPNTPSGSGGAGGGPAPGSGGNGGGPIAPPGPAEQPANCTPSGAGAEALHARMLSPSQYNNTIEDLLKVGGQPSRDFGGGNAETQLDDLGVERRATAAANIAKQAATSMAGWAPCMPAAGNEDACADQLIDHLGLRAFRRPLAAADRTQLRALFDAGRKEKDFATGVEWLLTGILQSPDFLYQFARPATGEKSGELRAVTGYEMASRLSYFLWDSMPDEKLFAAAGATKGLADVASIEKELTRMVDDPRFLRGVTSYYTTWLSLDGFNELARDDKAFTTELVHALGKSLLMSATELYGQKAPNLSSLLAGESYYLDASLRAFYGKTGSQSGSDGFTPTTFGNEKRFGLLTHPALMAQLARPQKTHPINRGLFFRSKLLCQELAPPAGVDIPALPEMPKEGVTTRQEVVDHVRPECASCHAMLDPPGLALEGFDQVGRLRATENGQPVDTSGKMVNAGDLEGDFAKGEEMLAKVGNSATVRACFAQQYFQFALVGDVARHVADADRCAADGVSKLFAASGDLKKLVVAIATSSSFRTRASEGVGQ
jgi:hypothetical protein